MMRRVFSAVLLGLAITACVSCSPSQSSDPDAIRAVIAGLTDAYKERDWDAFAGYFTEDAVWMPPNRTNLVGKDEWWSMVERWWHTTSVVEMGVETRDLIVERHWAIERHDEWQTTVNEDGDLTTRYFKGIWILERQSDGSWKIARYIWNYSPSDTQ